MRGSFSPATPRSLTLLSLPLQTHFLPESDQLSLSRMQIMADVAVAMGGRAAEEVIFGPKMITTGTICHTKWEATRDAVL
jgi:ATP-dependent Zn protease